MKEKMEATLLSESSLRKDWLSPEEDEAWGIDVLTFDY
jgi:hypothetical protein